MKVTYEQRSGHWLVTVDGRVLSLEEAKKLRDHLNVVLSRIGKHDRSQ